MARDLITGSLPGFRWGKSAKEFELDWESQYWALTRSFLPSLVALEPWGNGAPNANMSRNNGLYWNRKGCHYRHAAEMIKRPPSYNSVRVRVCSLSKSRLKFGSCIMKIASHRRQQLIKKYRKDILTWKTFSDIALSGGERQERDRGVEGAAAGAEGWGTWRVYAFGDYHPPASESSFPSLSVSRDCHTVSSWPKCQCRHTPNQIYTPQKDCPPPD